jgi:hypothetical protein
VVVLGVVRGGVLPAFLLLLLLLRPALPRLLLLLLLRATVQGCCVQLLLRCLGAGERGLAVCWSWGCCPNVRLLMLRLAACCRWLVLRRLLRLRGGTAQLQRGCSSWAAAAALESSLLLRRPKILQDRAGCCCCCCHPPVLLLVGAAAVAVGCRARGARCVVLRAATCPPC